MGAKGANNRDAGKMGNGYLPHNLWCNLQSSAYTFHPRWSASSFGERLVLHTGRRRLLPSGGGPNAAGKLTPTWRCAAPRTAPDLREGSLGLHQ